MQKQELDLKIFIHLNEHNDYTYFIVVNGKLHKTTQPLKRYLLTALKLPVQDRLFQLTMGIKRIYGCVCRLDANNHELVMIVGKPYLNVINEKLSKPTPVSIPVIEENLQLELF